MFAASTWTAFVVHEMRGTAHNGYFLPCLRHCWEV